MFSCCDVLCLAVLSCMTVRCTARSGAALRGCVVRLASCLHAACCMMRRSATCRCALFKVVPLSAGLRCVVLCCRRVMWRGVRSCCVVVSCVGACRVWGASWCVAVGCAVLRRVMLNCVASCFCVVLCVALC